MPGTPKIEANSILRAGRHRRRGVGLRSVSPADQRRHDVRGGKTLVLRAAAGLFFDRPDGNTVFNSVNPPVASAWRQWGRLSV